LGPPCTLPKMSHRKYMQSLLVKVTHYSHPHIDAQNFMQFIL